MNNFTTHSVLLGNYIRMYLKPILLFICILSLTIFYLLTYGDLSDVSTAVTQSGNSKDRLPIHVLRTSSYFKNRLRIEEVPLILREKILNRIKNKSVNAFSPIIELSISPPPPFYWGKPDRQENPFMDLYITLDIPREYVHKSIDPGASDKYFVGPNAIADRGKKFIVYGFGTAGGPNARGGGDTYKLLNQYNRQTYNTQLLLYHLPCWQ